MKNWNLKTVLIGRARDLSEQGLFHKISLIAVLAWVGLGADGLSSSCYGPEETFKALGAHSALSVFVALASVATIVVICASYRQIIELFPTGGGGYLVASKLLSPAAGVVSGSALLVDYVLTITISVASGADQLFSVLPAAWQPWRIAFACAGVGLLTLINLRGVREAVLLWVPVFFVFVGTHAVAILLAILGHASDLPGIASQTAAEVGRAQAELGLVGMLALMLKAYSLGAGTYTGIEAVSNGLPILREPRVQTGRHTMNYMGASLAITGIGLGFTTFILVSLCVVKFHEGGWVTLVVTGAVVTLAFLVKHHYLGAMKEFKRLEELVEVTSLPATPVTARAVPGRTAIVFVNGFNGLGLHTFLGISRLFPDTFGRFIFVQIGGLDAGSFKGVQELERLKAETRASVQRYVDYARRHGFQAETVAEVGHDVVGKIAELGEELLRCNPGAVLFGGQLAFANETRWTRWLHNHAVFALQRIFCRHGVPFVIVPIKV